MAIGYWGDFEFEVSSNKIYTFDGFGRKASIDIEEQELEGQKASTYIKGEVLEDISIDINLKSLLGANVRGEIDNYRTVLYQKTPKSFVIGEKPLSQNKWLLTNVDESDVVMDNKGNYISAKIALTFKEYVRGGSKKAETATSTAAGSTSSAKTKGATSGGVIDKLDGTRYNTNAEQSKASEPSHKTIPTLIRNPFVQSYYAKQDTSTSRSF